MESQVRRRQFQSDLPRVLLQGPLHWPPFRATVTRVARFGFDSNLWTCDIHYGTRLPENYLSSEMRWQAAVVFLNDKAQLDLLLARSSLVINLSSSFGPHPTVRRIVSDDRQAGILAAETLARRGAVSFTFCGLAPGEHYGFQERLVGFRDRVAELGLRFHCQMTRGVSERELKQIIESAPRPLAIFCCNDGVGMTLCRQVLNAGYHVPEDVLLLGFENDETICESACIPLSSICTDASAFAETCVHALQDFLVAGRMPEDALIPPGAPVLRESTACSSSKDILVERAIRLLKESRIPPKSIAEWAKMSGTSRRPLEKHLLAVYGKTPKAILDEERIRRAVRLLEESKLDHESIAAATGFSSARRMHAVFQRRLGKTPQHFRSR